VYIALIPTLITRLWPRANALTRNGFLVIGGSLLVAALAQIRIPLPFTPVPLTGQTFGVLLVGALLGSRRGVTSLAVYIVAGLAGLPFFAGGGSGWAYLAGPTGGYLLGFVISAFVVGSLAERGLERRWQTVLLPFLAGEAILYLCGVPWLSVFVGAGKALRAGFWPFLVGDALKLVLAAMLLPTMWKFVRE
jgi:biotin transport system substrate-specific component